MTEIELGNAPPIEYVIKNIHIDEAELKAKVPVNAHQVAEDVWSRLLEQEAWLKQLKEERERDIEYLNKVEHKPQPLHLPP